MRWLVDWLKAKDNREAVLAFLTVATTVLGGGWYLYDRLSGPGSDSNSPPAVYSIAEHEAALARREVQIRADLGEVEA